jgi:uroporphyrinogen-III synthase
MRTVLLTRPDSLCAPLQTLLKQANFQVILRPTIEFHFPKDEEEKHLSKYLEQFEAGKYGGIALSSPTAVRLLFELRPQLLTQKNQHTIWFLLGKQSALFLPEEVKNKVILAQTPSREGLVQTILSHESKLRPKSIIFPHSSLMPLEALQPLKEANIIYVAPTLYETRTKKNAEALPKHTNIDAIVFTSSSSLDGFEALYNLPRTTPIVCIGKATLQRSKDLGWKNIFQANTPAPEAIVEALKTI